MGQATRDRKKDLFFSRIPESIEGYMGRINMLLNVLTDEQLDEVLGYLAIEGDDEDDATCENCGAPCEYDTDICLCKKCLAESGQGDVIDRLDSSERAKLFRQLEKPTPPID